MYYQARSAWSQNILASLFSVFSIFSVFFQFFVLLVAPKFLSVNTATGHNFRSIWMKFAHNQHFIIPQIYFFHFFEKNPFKGFYALFSFKNKGFPALRPQFSFDLDEIC